ncbi:cAMP phosphodiesterase class-II [Sclerotinia borealis F-4128]|uniref:cAMP phosphodiesterase class-II n=1 Tax=Sclerotinia borealis (strain F-4128) TaxID=1432307 RepID=W9CLN8_SCLBF|nr:cAMP phosphodiesterase class-II [Sclerotinia borealis F-4128]
MMDNSKQDVEGSPGTSFQVIVLGAGGGPMEDNCTSFLVRSMAQGWSKGSILAVDTGVHLSAIDRLLEQYTQIPPERPHTLQGGPFAGLILPNKSSEANTAHIARNLIGAHLITHPHLDHIAGGIISTASPSSKARVIAGLASTIEALKNHIFNDVIWPNLSDENGGVGLVTFRRLVSGGSSVLGVGNTKGYVEVVEGLGVKSWGVSHGICIGEFPYRSNSEIASTPTIISSLHSASTHGPISSPDDDDHQRRICTSSAFFILDFASGHEILIWGDAEPDSISLYPRNKQVWADAAPKIVRGTLKAIFIECSFDDSRATEMLFGHFAPRFLIEELEVLAAEVERCRDESQSPRRQRDRDRERGSPGSPTDLDYFRKSISIRKEKRGLGVRPPPINTPSYAIHSQGHRRASGDGNVFHEENALEGVKIVIIHVKEKMEDGEEPREVILRQLKAFEKDSKLGCEFVVSEKGMNVYL